MARLDPHSHHDSTQSETQSFELRVRVDFAARVLEGEVSLTLAASDARRRGGALDLDTRDLTIHSVQGPNGQSLPFELGRPDPVLGARLRVTLPPDTERLTIRYRTSDQASALGWLEPEQTASKHHPYLFSQCQAIHARSIVPLQDTPRRRVTFSAELDVPDELASLMAARFVERRAGGVGRAVDRWEMPEAIPPYLLALAVGRVVSRELSPRVRVWAEPSVIDAAAHEFDGVEPMIEAAERLFGPYDWERFDLLVMPPSFPYGGMENPRLTFLTPSIIAGDRSLVNVVAHELSHSWTGNLVSNASAEHFWLNEGFTVYAERRIIEAIDGREEAELQAAVGRKELLRVLEELALHPELTRLRSHLDGIDPDHAFSIVPYEKGYLMLRAIEESEGRARWDEFLRRYMRAYRFRALTTEEWLDFLERELPGAAERAGVNAYLHSAGLPSSAPVPRSARLDRVLALPPGIPDRAHGAELTPLEWRLYLDHLPRPSAPALCAELESRFALSQSQNAEILSGWLELALESNYEPAVPRALAFLGEVGRMKYLKPLYKALLSHPNTRDAAEQSFERHRAAYHPIARHVIESLFAAIP
ncbi:MAG TPA: M1 family metallopeptidase [Polyangiaceae bacterium]|nr:M1 family metallopeptidase [Polyangiaceae bacterium]